MKEKTKRTHKEKIPDRTNEKKANVTNTYVKKERERTYI
jgi:hypothetical protein